MLPRDFTREVPAAGWRWLIQYGLPYSYWKPYTGYSPAEERLVITHGNPIETSLGRFIGGNGGSGVRPVHEGQASVPSSVDDAGRWNKGLAHADAQGAPRRWKQWGDKLRSAYVLEPEKGDSAERLVLVEDIVSAHKVRQAGYYALPLFGTELYPKAIKAIQALNRPTSFWMDEDVWEYLPKKINRLQAFLEAPVGFVKTRKDPKEYALSEIQEILR